MLHKCEASMRALTCPRVNVFRKTRETCSWCANKEEIVVFGVANDLFCYSVLLNKLEIQIVFFIRQLQVSFVLWKTLTRGHVGVCMEAPQIKTIPKNQFFKNTRNPEYIANFNFQSFMYIKEYKGSE